MPTVGTTFENLQSGDERAYDALAHAVQANVPWLLAPFEAHGDDGSSTMARSTETSSRKLLKRLEDFAEVLLESRSALTAGRNRLLVEASTTG